MPKVVFGVLADGLLVKLSTEGDEPGGTLLSPAEQGLGLVE
jgi:hypothetical protein